MSSSPELLIAPCTYKAALWACRQWHYSGRMSSGKMVYYGVWEGGRFVGAVVFSNGVTPHLFKRYGLTGKEGAELTRVALGEHATPTSRIVALAVRLLRRQNPGLRLVVSFADQGQNHVGTIYQASNWVYAGETTFCQEYEYRGRRTTQRTIGPLVARGRLRLEDLKPLPTCRKYRYLYPLDREMRRRIEPLRRPYPKRVRGDTSDTPGCQPGEGGATPTRTLQEITA